MSGTTGSTQGGPVQGSGGERAVPYVCPYCGEEELRPLEGGRWHCRSCLRAFSVAFHGLLPASASTPAPPAGTQS